MEGSDGTCESTTDTTILVQIEEVKCAIRKLPLLTVFLSREHRTKLACLQELIKQLQVVLANWTEDQFVVTASSGIRDRDTRVDEIVARESQKTKPGKWGYVQAREL